MIGTRTHDPSVQGPDALTTGPHEPGLTAFLSDHIAKALATVHESVKRRRGDLKRCAVLPSWLENGSREAQTSGSVLSVSSQCCPPLGLRGQLSIHLGTVVHKPNSSLLVSQEPFPGHRPSGSGTQHLLLSAPCSRLRPRERGSRLPCISFFFCFFLLACPGRRTPHKPPASCLDSPKHHRMHVSDLQSKAPVTTGGHPRLWPSARSRPHKGLLQKESVPTSTPALPRNGGARAISGLPSLHL